MPFIFQSLGLTVFVLLFIYWAFAIFNVSKRARLSNARLQAEHQLIEQQVSQLIQKFKLSENAVDLWSGWRKFRISKIVSENETVKSFYLKPHDGKPLPHFLPGQHLTFRLKVPGKSKPVIRCYSLSDNANENGYYRISIRRQSAPPDAADAPAGVASCFFHDQLAKNDVLDVKAPSGKFYLETSERGPIALVAGGIGLTPSLSMLNTLSALNSERPVFLFYAARDLDDLIMVKHFSSLELEMSNLTIHYFLGELDEQLATAHKHQGFITIDKMFHLMSESVNPSDADFYVCGPPPMMDAIVGGLETQMIHPERIHFESFGPASINQSTKAVVQADKPEPCKVNFHLSEKTVDWELSSGTLLEAAESVGIAMDSGCRAGSCGTCLTAILEGEVEYIDEPGTDVEKGSCLPCIAIPTKNLKLNA